MRLFFIFVRRLHLGLGPGLLLGALGACTHATTIDELPRHPVEKFVALENDPLPPQPSSLSPQLREAWKLLNDFEAQSSQEHNHVTYAELTPLIARGGYPWQRARVDLRARAEVLLKAAESNGTTNERVIAHALRARFAESLSFDWSIFFVEECTLDPTVCKWGGDARLAVIKPYIVQSDHEYRVCEALAHDADESMRAWERHCRSRVSMILHRRAALEV